MNPQTHTAVDELIHSLCWDAGYHDGITGKPPASKGEAYEAGYTAGEAVYVAVELPKYSKYFLSSNH